MKGSFGNIMGAAADTVKQKLNNIKGAYESNGGGVKGVVAASLEAVKGYYTAGLTFIDNLTGGKLSEIKQKFTDGLQAAAGAVNDRLNSIKDGFNEKMTAAGNLVKGAIDRIKGFFHITFPTPKIKMPHVKISGEFSIAPPRVPTFGVDWYAEGGIMTRPTIFGAAGGKLLGGGEAGDEAILPLSALWDKLRQFIHDETGTGEDRGDGAASIVKSLTQKETRTVERRTTESSVKEIQSQESGEGRGNTIIQKLELRVDIEKLKDLPMLFRLLDEIKDAQNSSDAQAAT